MFLTAMNRPARVPLAMIKHCPTCDTDKDTSQFHPVQTGLKERRHYTPDDSAYWRHECIPCYLASARQYNRKIGLWSRINGPTQGDLVPVEDFRRVLHKMKETKGWTLEEMARQGSMPVAAMRHLLSKRHMNDPTKRDVELILKRLAGMPAPPTKFAEAAERKTVYMPDNTRYIREMVAV